MANRVGQQLGNYKLETLLGEGGFAEVYLAEHIHLKHKKAIKVLRTTLSEQEGVSFRIEAQRLAQLTHPHIIPILDFDEREGFPYLVMEYALNGSLRDRHPKGSHIPLPTIVTYVKQVASALQYIHGQKLIHRDVKPENMLLGQDNKILLSDVGIAVVAHSEYSQRTQQTTGTPYYMAPEQFRGKAEPASDQYSLGVVVYEWISGALPFSEGDSLQLGFQHAFEPPPPLRSNASTVSPDVEKVVMMALAKGPKERFETVRAFAIALEQASQSDVETFIKHPISKVPQNRTLHPSSPFPEKQVDKLSQSLQKTEIPVNSEAGLQEKNLRRRKRGSSSVGPSDKRRNLHITANTHRAENNVESHYPQLIFSSILLILAFFLFGMLTVFRDIPLFSAIAGAFLFLFGWGAYLLPLGLSAFAIAHIVESIQNRKLIRWSLVIGLIVLWLIVLAESHLLLGGVTGGLLGSLLTRPLQGWSVAIGHILLIGLFAIVTIIAFQITAVHIMRVLGIASNQRKKTASSNNSGPSPFLGQRPRYSRYSAMQQPPQREQDQGRPVEAEEDNDIISFEPDFDEDNDPLNDININKKQL